MTPEWARQYKLVQETVPRSKVVGAVGRYKDDVDEREHSIDLTEDTVTHLFDNDTREWDELGNWHDTPFLYGSKE